MRTAQGLARSGLIDLDSLVTNRIGFDAEADVARVFSHYGSDGDLKTMVSVGS